VDDFCPYIRALLYMDLEPPAASHWPIAGIFPVGTTCGAGEQFSRAFAFHFVFAWHVFWSFG